jgi:hypothetical protein
MEVDRVGYGSMTKTWAILRSGGYPGIFHEHILRYYDEGFPLYGGLLQGFRSRSCMTGIGY